MKSIRRLLLGSLCTALLVGLSGAAYLVFEALNDEVGELFDAQLVQASYAVPSELVPELTSGRHHHTDDDPSKQLVIAMWEKVADQPIYRSPTQVSLARPQSSGLHTEVIAGEPWRIYARMTADHWIAAAQPLAVRREATREIAQRLAIPVLVLIPIMGTIVWYLIARGLLPLTEFARELKTRSPTALQNISTAELPVELTPIAIALNDLMKRLEQALATQQNFIGDAAHEILTPLTALQVQVQVLEKAKTEERRTQAIQDVRASLTRCINLARQLLALARQSAETPRASFRHIDLVTVARDVVQNALPNGHDRRIDLGVLAPKSVPVMGDELALQLLLRNLIDNAIKYSHLGGRVDVVIAADPPVLTVSDAGPGIASQDRERLFDRFYRGTNTEVDGTGLGLAIVKQIADRHDAKIEVESPGRLGGLDIVVRFCA